MKIKAPTVEQCRYWDNESNFCGLYRPAATKHGRWIVCNDLYKTIDGRVFDGYRECSVCGEMYPYFPEHNYCPNCGADMRERREDE